MVVECTNGLCLFVFEKLSFYLQKSLLKTGGNTSLTFRSWLLKYVSFWDFFYCCCFFQRKRKVEKNCVGSHSLPGIQWAQLTELTRNYFILSWSSESLKFFLKENLTSFLGDRSGRNSTASTPVSCVEEADVTSPSKHPKRLSRGQREQLKCSLGLSLGGDVAQFQFLLLITGIVLHVLHL